MPKFYCEYCGIYLTHSSPSGRGQHAKGRKHINNRIEYYKQVIEDINKENQDKMKQIHGAQSSALQNQPLNFPAAFQNPSQIPMLMQLQQLSAGGISQVQINSSNQVKPPINAGPGQPPVSQQQQLQQPPMQPQFMNMPPPKGAAPGMQAPFLPPPGSAPLRQGGPQQMGPPMGMMPPLGPGMIGMPPGMKTLPGMPMGHPGGMFPPGMMGMPPMQFPPPHMQQNMGFNPMDPNQIKNIEHTHQKEEMK